MTDLWLLCEHGHAKSHLLRGEEDLYDRCPGGHRASVEEVVEWLEGQREVEKTTS